MISCPGALPPTILLRPCFPVVHSAGATGDSLPFLTHAKQAPALPSAYRHFPLQFQFGVLQHMLKTTSKEKLFLNSNNSLPSIGRLSLSLSQRLFFSIALFFHLIQYTFTYLPTFYQSYTTRIKAPEGAVFVLFCLLSIQSLQKACRQCIISNIYGMNNE